MGWVRDKTFTLDLDGTDATGLTVRCRPVSIDLYMEMMDLTDNGLPLTAENRDRVGRVIEIVAGSLIEWDLDDHDGAQVPCDEAGLRSQDKDLVLAVVNGWIAAQAAVPGPLGQRSTGGGPSLEASMPMEPLSASPAI